MRWPWSPRWEIVIVGQLSGNVTRLTFVRFRRFNDARRWADRMNERHPDNNGTYFDVEPIEE